MKEMLETRHQGAFALEYLIVAIIMIVAIFAAWRFLGDAIVHKMRQVADFITNNGQRELGR